MQKTKKIINVAVVGYGYWGPNLVRNMHDTDGINLLACCELRKDRLAIIKQKYPQVQVTTKFEDLLKNKKIDAIVIATPCSSHFDLAKKALLAGKHVWMEKPMTETSAQAKELIELAKKKKKIIFVDHIFLYTEAVQLIKKLILSNKMGRLYYFDSTRINLGLFQPDANVIWDLAPHDISIMCYLLDEIPTSVSVFANSHAGSKYEDIAYLNFKFKGKKTAHVRVSWLSPVKIRQTLIGGTKKMIVYDDLESSEKIRVYDYGVEVNKATAANFSTNRYEYRTGDIIVPAIKSKEALQNACNSFYQALVTGKDPISNGRNGLLVVKIIEAAQKSLKSNGEETIIE